MNTTGLRRRIREGFVKPPRNYTAEVDADLNAAAIAGALVALDNLDECSATEILADSPAGRRIISG